MDHGVQYAISSGFALVFLALIFCGYHLDRIATVLQDMRRDGLNARVSDLTFREAKLQEALAEMEDDECG